MDTLLESFPSPDFIKIDIEGAEYMAIQGATRVIEDVRPIFYIEIGNEVSHKIFEIFRQAKYSIFNFKGEPLSKIETTSNIFFVPEEKVEMYLSR